MAERRPRKSVNGQSIEELQRALIRLWGRQLDNAGFTRDEAARLILAKLSYLRGGIPD